MVAVKDFFLRCNFWIVTGETEQPRKFGFFTFNINIMSFIIKNGQRQTLELNCKKVVITMTTYRLSTKRVSRLKIKAKGKRPQINQARL